MKECNDKYNLANKVFLVNMEDVLIKDGVVSIKRKHKEKKRLSFKVK
jgi:hypothetical protein